MNHLITHITLCITGYLGCHTDVVNILDNDCSGKQNCDFPVWSNLEGREDLSACKQGLQMYLETDYKCVQGKT